MPRTRTTTPSRCPDHEHHPEAHDDPRGQHQGLERPPARADVEAGQRVLHRPDQGGPGQQEHDPAGHDQRRAQRRVEDRQHQRRRRGRRRARGVDEEHGQAARPGQADDGRHRGGAGEGRQRPEQPGAQQDRDGGRQRRRTGGQRRRRPGRPPGAHPAQPLLGARAVDPPVHQVLDQRRDALDQAVVQPALTHDAQPDDRGGTGRPRPARRDGPGRDVHVDAAQPARAGHRGHRGRHVRRPRPRGEQQLPAAQRQVQRPVRLRGVVRGVGPAGADRRGDARGGAGDGVAERATHDRDAGRGSGAPDRLDRRADGPEGAAAPGGSRPAVGVLVATSRRGDQHPTGAPRPPRPVVPSTRDDTRAGGRLGRRAHGFSSSPLSSTGRGIEPSGTGISARPSGPRMSTQS